MKAIQELIRLLQKYDTTGASTFKIPFKNHSPARQFFHFLLRHPIENDEQAATRFFQLSSKAPSYRRIKRSLENQLIQGLFLVDLDKMGNTAHQRAYYHCWKNMCAVKILLGQSAHHSAIKLVQKVLKRSKKHELNDLCLESYRILRWYFGCMESGRAKYLEYDHKFKQQQRLCAAEQKAEDYYTYLSSIYLSDKGQRHFLAGQALKYWEEVSELMNEYPSMRLHFLGHLIHIYHHYCSGDYRRAVEANQQAISFFEQTNRIPALYIHTFYNHQLACYIQLKYFGEGMALVQKLDRLIKPGTTDWFLNRQYFFLLAMHSGKYEQARQIFDQVCRRKKFKYLPRVQAEKWQINRAYLYFLEIANLLELKPSRPQAFCPKQFIKDLPLYCKDKRGMNVPILIISILILLAERRYNELIDRMEALEKYRGRYLRTEDAYRSNCFIKMLTSIPEANFHPKAVQRKAAKYRKCLERTPLPISNQAFDLEIIPYEDLWEMAQKLL